MNETFQRNCIGTFYWHIFGNETLRGRPFPSILARKDLSKLMRNSLWFLLVVLGLALIFLTTIAEVGKDSSKE